MSNNPSSGYSAQVRLRLECGELTIPLAQVAPDWVIAAQSVELLPMAATLVVEVDGDEHRKSVYLPKGMSSTSRMTEIQQTTKVA